MSETTFTKPEWMFASTIKVDIVSAEELIFSGSAKLLVAPGMMGPLGVLPGHAPLLTVIDPGEIRLIKLDGSEESYYVSGGFLEVQPDLVTILADTVVRAKDIDEQRALEAKAKAEEILLTKKYDNYTAALTELSKVTAQLRVLKKWQKIK
jgi:F-type H+-transporting ATPase subunit epsilon